MLLSFTPNPALDRTLIVPGFRSAEACRIAEERIAAGGKGLNVVRAARTLGVPVRACGPLGGEAGRRLAALAEAEGIAAQWSWLEQGETRTCLLVIDPAAPDTLALNGHGPRISEADWDALAATVRAAAEGAAAVAVSGSLPPGASVERFIALLDELAKTRPLLLDTSGGALAAALRLPLALLKINAHELGEALGRPIATRMAACAAAAEVCALGPQAVIVTLGRAGAVAVDSEGAWWARPPEVALISPVGSGDALLAGVAAALLEGARLAEALRLGVACGSANTLTIGGGVLRMDDVTRLRAATTLVPC